MSPSDHSHHGPTSSMFAETTEPTPLPLRFAKVKQGLIAGKESQIASSWKRLLVKLQSEIEVVASAGPDIFPSIAFADLQHASRNQDFVSKLKERGVAVIRGVIPRDTAVQWNTATDSYLNEDPRARRLPTHDPHLYGVYWSPAQIKARAHDNVLCAQRFLMNLWRPSDPSALVTPNFPVSYADRLRIRSPDDETCSLSVYVDGGSVERWESDGYGQGATYQRIWDGDWENWNPWDSSTRLKVSSDLYNGDGVCALFRMFQGWLSLSDLPVGEGTLMLCPMIRLSTAYLLLRPFFAPIDASPSRPGFLSPENWRLEQPTSSVIQGALPSYPQELNAALHPHLQLARSMVHIPRLEPGDYLVWHCDAVYALDRLSRPDLPCTTIMYLPACPLTQTNALYLARQRKAFLLGHPSPDFGGVFGESARTGSSGVQEVGEAGGVEGLRAMGLLPWDEDEARDDTEQEVLEAANGILFPEKYDLGYY
ncbi:hypothetical protein EDB81DRAFT_382168 [Dactylonectria macrodidyma]|uniref:DUF1479-domain-containing protein n=1 Tax=Dactylonectria macrodidyma TaxID=307937 RepID=A0A9P9FA65_9HYPO|nr:hypothetical protein EDB81DRAFT_382168 [Dactylonectria macrodidyma]